MRARKLIRRWESYVEDKLIKSAAFEEGVTEDLLHLIEGYGLVRAVIDEGSSFVGNSLSACKLTEQEVLVLGIERGKNWIPTPSAEEIVEVADRLVVYGRLETLRALFREDS